MVLGQYSARGSQRHYFNRPYLTGLQKRYQQRGDDGQPLYRPVRAFYPGSSPSHGICEIYEEPREGVEYSLAADVAKGVLKGLDGVEDRDYSVMSVMRRDTGREVAVYWGREDCSPERFGDDIANLGTWYNNALVIVEINNHGRSTYARLVSLEYPNLYTRRAIKTDPNGNRVETQEWGFETTVTTKPIADNYLAELLNDAAAGHVRFEPRSPRGIQELLNYGHLATLTGSKAGALVGHDDHVRAYALNAVIVIEEPLTDWSKLKPVEPHATAGRMGMYGYPEPRMDETSDYALFEPQTANGSRWNG